MSKECFVVYRRGGQGPPRAVASSRRRGRRIYSTLPKHAWRNEEKSRKYSHASLFQRLKFELIFVVTSASSSFVTMIMCQRDTSWGMCALGFSHHGHFPHRRIVVTLFSPSTTSSSVYGSLFSAKLRQPKICVGMLFY